MPAPATTDLVGLMAEAYRLRLLRGLEEELTAGGIRRVAGVDEAGRGCLAGPVVAAAVLMPSESALPGIDDSKRLDPAQRERLAARIRDMAIATSVVAVEASTIDCVNILQATRQAMTQALSSLDPAPECALTDAVALVGLPFPVVPLVRGDSFCYAIGCASILAKVERDRMMTAYDREWPEYGFARNKGYGAPEHLRALAELGPTPIHRLTFGSVVPRIAEQSGGFEETG